MGVRYGSTVWEYGMGARYGSTVWEHGTNPVADGAAALTEPVRIWAGCGSTVYGVMV